jgi:ATP synthase protein I
LVVTKSISTKGQQLAKHVVLLQTCAGLLSAVIVATLMGSDNGLAALIGVLANVVPTAIFAFFAFRYSGGTKNDLVVRSFRKGSALKLLFTILIFAWVFKKTDIHVLPLFIGYIVALFAQWPAIIYLQRAPTTK